MNSPESRPSTAAVFTIFVLGGLDGLAIIIGLASIGAADCGIGLSLVLATVVTLGLPFVIGISVPLSLTFLIPRFRIPNLRIHTTVTISLLAISIGAIAWQGIQYHLHAPHCVIV